MPDPINPKPELTLQEILAYVPPPALKAWTFTPDQNGGVSYRAHVNGIQYSAVPDDWEGRTLPLSMTKGNSSMGSLANGVLPQELAAAVPGSFTTNNPDFRPTGTESTAKFGPDPIVNYGVDYQPFLVPVAILIAAVVYAVLKLKKG